MQYKVIGNIFPINASNSTQNTPYVKITDYSDVYVVYLFGSVDANGSYVVRESINTSDSAGQTLAGFSESTTASSDNTIQIRNPKSLTSFYKYIRGRVSITGGTTNFVSVFVFAKDLFNPGQAVERIVHGKGSDVPTVVSR